MSDLQELLKQIDPEDYLSWLSVDFKVSSGHSGVQINVHECPRCGGNKWKVYLNANTGLGNCFHGDCAGEPGFNLYTFTQHLLGGRQQAFEALTDYAKTIDWKPALPAKDRTAASQIKRELKLPESSEIAGVVPDYLIKRGFTTDDAMHFGWRYCKVGHFEYLDSRGGVRRQSYSGRIIIPVCDLDGNVVTFQGRDTTGVAEKKYLFPPGLPGTAKYLYHGHETPGCEEVILNEGVFDVASTWKAIREDRTLDNVGVVGTFGIDINTSLETEGQLAQLLRLKASGMKRAILMWDGEPKAIQVALHKGLELKRKLGVEVKIAMLAGKDPNEMEPAQIRYAYRQARPITEAFAGKVLMEMKVRGLLGRQ